MEAAPAELDHLLQENRSRLRDDALAEGGHQGRGIESQGVAVVVEDIGEGSRRDILPLAPGGVTRGTVDDVPIEQEHPRVLEDVGDPLHLALRPPVLEVGVEHVTGGLERFCRERIRGVDARQSRAVAVDELLDLASAFFWMGPAVAIVGPCVRPEVGL